LRHLDSEDPTHEEQSMLRSESLDDDAERDHETERSLYSRSKRYDENARLGLRATAKLSLEFCLLWVWFIAILDSDL
jgi:solute carrier family 35 protein F5